VRGSDPDPPVSLASCRLHHLASGSVGECPQRYSDHLPLLWGRFQNNIVENFAMMQSSWGDMGFEFHIFTMTKYCALCALRLIPAIQSRWSVCGVARPFSLNHPWGPGKQGGGFFPPNSSNRRPCVCLQNLAISYRIFDLYVSNASPLDMEIRYCRHGRIKKSTECPPHGLLVPRNRSVGKFIGHGPVGRQSSGPRPRSPVTTCPGASLAPNLGVKENFNSACIIP
jgi:hypothetical protein